MSSGMDFVSVRLKGVNRKHGLEWYKKRSERVTKL
jgi:hypothetical protein